MSEQKQAIAHKEYREPCGICGAPSTNATRNVYRCLNSDGSYSFAPCGAFYWRCEQHSQQLFMYDVSTVMR